MMTLLLASALASPLPGDAVAARALETVQTALRASGSSATVAVVGRVADVAGMGADTRIEVGEIGGRWPRPRASVPVRVSDAQGNRRTVTVWLAAEDTRSVLTYGSDYTAATGSDALLAAPAQVNLVCCEGQPVTSLQEVQGQRLRRAARRGAPVLREDFVPMPDVVAQQPVTLAVERGAVRIVLPGMALDDGMVGERISVRPQGSQVAVRARVSAPSEVMIDE